MKILDGKKNILTLTKEEIEEFILGINEDKYRAGQVYRWLWKNGVRSFEEMKNIPLKTKSSLNCNFTIHSIELAEVQFSDDGTIKSSFKLFDGQRVEGVLIPASDRLTACISSQVGCSMVCKFCATGQMDHIRNLEASEIYDQVLMIDKQAKEHFKKGLTNIVYMGMGEPLLNYNNVLKSIEKITSPDFMGMSNKRITLSTVGIAKMIKKLADDDIKFNLAVSLHAANDKKRSEIIPINEHNSLRTLIDSLKYFYKKTDTKVTYEYIIFKNFNDELSDARELADFCKHIPCKVNIIEYNPIANGVMQQAETTKVKAFIEFLKSKNIVANIRKSRGKDIDAACGQLANKPKL